jgi:hypothetical protein
MKDSDKFNNLYEDLLSAVRIYTRLNLFNIDKKWEDIIFVDSNTETLTYKATLTNNNNKLQKSSNSSSTTTTVDLLNVNDIYSVSKTTTNYDLFNGDVQHNKSKISWINKPLKGVFDQLTSGYNAFLFGYGFSGSGKTYTLFGKYNKDEPGVVQIGIQNLIKTPEEQISVKPYAAFDIYGQTKFEGKLSELTSSAIIKYYVENDNVLPSIFGNNSLDIVNQPFTIIENKIETYEYNSELPIDSINMFLTKINEARKKDVETKLFNNIKCVKATINNKESSRGHLFVIFEVINSKESGKKKNYLILRHAHGCKDCHFYRLKYW